MELLFAAALNGQLNPKDKKGGKLIEKFSMSAEFDVLYGTCSALPELIPDYSHTSMAHGHSTILLGLKDEQPGWAFLSKIGKDYKASGIPRREPSQANAHVQKFSDFEFGNNKKLTKLWKNVTNSSFAALEEGFMKTWTHGRFICSGDAVHKATINFRQIALTGIEDVVTLTNNLVKMLDNCPSSILTDNQIQEAFQDCQKSRKRRRAKGFSDFSNNMAGKATYTRIGNKV